MSRGPIQYTVFNGAQIEGIGNFLVRELDYPVRHLSAGPQGQQRNKLRIQLRSSSSDRPSA